MSAKTGKEDCAVTQPSKPVKQYLLYAGPECEFLAQRLAENAAFTYVESKFEKFPDGNDNIQLGGFDPNLVRDANVLFVTSLHSNDATMQTLHALQVLLESDIGSMTVVAPFFPFGTMERVVKEGTVATANTIARMFSQLPSCGPQLRFVTFDLHTLQNRFYFNTNAIANLQTAIPLLTQQVEFQDADYIVFPDAGAQKRFGTAFASFGKPTMYCNKVRRGDAREIEIVHDGCDLKGRAFLVDDLVRTGGTLAQTAVALRAEGATWVGAFCTHAAGSPDQLAKFQWTSDSNKGNDLILDRFFLTDSVPTVVKHLPRDNVFCILPLCGLIANAL